MPCLRWLLALACLFPLAARSQEPPAAELVHPLDPLTATELASVRAVLRDSGKLPADAYFPAVALLEPSKEVVARFQPGQPRARQARVEVSDGRSRLWEAEVDLTAQKLLAWRELPGVHPAMLMEDYEIAAEIVLKDERWRKAMLGRGFTEAELAQVYLDVWAPGYVADPPTTGARLVRALTFFRGEKTNAYGSPVEGLVALVDLQRRQVIDLLDRREHAPDERPGGETDFFDPKIRGPQRPALKPLFIKQPDGASFTIRGHEIRWDRWRFRYALHPREGLVLYAVGYEEQGKVRPILHRASVSEMVVPYGDSDPAWNWRSAFDQGEYGLGRTANKLILGGDVPENAVLLDAVLPGDRGEAETYEDSVAVYERDGGVLFRHYDERTDQTFVRRGRELVICAVATIGNYDYLLNWVFHQDGVIECRIELTGILLVKGVQSAECEACLAAAQAVGEKPQVRGDQKYGTLVDKNIVATNHQHFFNFRLDFDLEGALNRVAEINVRPAPPGAENPAGNAFLHEETLLKTERDGRRNLSLADHRRWKIYNPQVRNRLGHYAGYVLDGAENGGPYTGADALLLKRAPFVKHHLWLTQWKPGELHAAGDYPRQSLVSTGLGASNMGEWSGDDSLVDQDLVVWYTLCVTHIPRPEEWPLMPTARTGFKLVPAGFFNRNPALDVPE